MPTALRLRRRQPEAPSRQTEQPAIPAPAVKAYQAYVQFYPKGRRPATRSRTRGPCRQHGARASAPVLQFLVYIKRRPSLTLSRRITELEVAIFLIADSGREHQLAGRARQVGQISMFCALNRHPHADHADIFQVAAHRRVPLGRTVLPLTCAYISTTRPFRSDSETTAAVGESDVCKQLSAVHSGYFSLHGYGEGSVRTD